MNLNEYFIKVLDDLQQKYEFEAYDYDLATGKYTPAWSSNPAEHYIILEALQRLEEIKALRAVAEIHRTVNHPLVSWCIGCGADSEGVLITRDSNNCPILRPLAKAWASGREDLPEYLK